MNITVDDFLSTDNSYLTTTNLSCGSYSDVYDTKDPNKVIKVSKNRDCFLYYAAAVCLKSDNPHALKVDAIKINTRKDNYSVLMEKAKVQLWKIYDDPAYQTHYDVYDWAYSVASTPSHADHYNAKFKHVIEKFPEVNKFIDLLIEEKKANTDLVNDMHHGNFMLRFDDSVVFTDPWAGSLSDTNLEKVKGIDTNRIRVLH